MKKALSICLVLFSFLCNLPAVESDQNAPESVYQPHVVAAVLSSVPDPDFEENPYTALLLDDNTVWVLIKENHIDEEAFPREGDTVQSTNGATFYNITRSGIFFASEMGHATEQPLTLDRIHKHNMFGTLQYFLASFLESQDDLHLMFDSDVEIVFYKLDNDLYYTVLPGPSSFVEWSEGEKVLLVRPEKKDIEEESSPDRLINISRREIRDIDPKEYTSDTVKEAHANALWLCFEGSEENWNIDPTQKEILRHWSPGDSVRILAEGFHFADLAETDPDLIWFLSMVFGEEMVQSLQGWEITIAIAINLETETSLFCWNWAYHNDEAESLLPMQHSCRPPALVKNIPQIWTKSGIVR